jgi:ligand-binding sensor domain-containing protein
VERALKARRAAAIAVLVGVLVGAGCREVVLYDDPPSGGTATPITWERTAGPSGESVLSLRTDQSGVLYAGTQSGRLYRTVTDGSSWTRIPLPYDGGAITAVVVDPVRRIFVANDVHGVYASIDGGASWLPFNDGLPDSAIYALAYLPGGSLIAGSGRGNLSVAAGGTAAWRRTWSFPRPVMSILPASGDGFYASVWGSGAYRFTAADSVPSTVNAGLPDLFINVLHSGAGGYYFAGTRNAGVFRTDPGQMFWQEAGGGSISRDVAALRTSVYGEVFAGTGTGVYLSTDAGARWMKLDVGIGSREVRALAINENVRVFAGTADGVYRSVRRN